MRHRPNATLYKASHGTTIPTLALYILQNDSPVTEPLDDAPELHLALHIRLHLLAAARDSHGAGARVRAHFRVCLHLPVSLCYSGSATTNNQLLTGVCLFRSMRWGKSGALAPL